MGFLGRFEDGLYTATFIATYISVPAMLTASLLAKYPPDYGSSIDNVLDPSKFEFFQAGALTILLAWLILARRQYKKNSP